VLSLPTTMPAGFVAHEKEKQFALYRRYQTTHQRSSLKCLSELLNLRHEKRKAEIGFESQERKRKEEVWKQDCMKPAPASLTPKRKRP
jgi:hypothetical protein